MFIPETIVRMSCCSCGYTVPISIGVRTWIACQQCGFPQVRFTANVDVMDPHTGNHLCRVLASEPFDDLKFPDRSYVIMVVAMDDISAGIEAGDSEADEPSQREAKGDPGQEHFPKQGAVNSEVLKFKRRRTR